MEEEPGSAENLWQTREVERIVHRQLREGSWKYPGGGKEYVRSKEDYNQIETFRVLGLLVEKHGLDRRHPAIEKAAEYLFSCQTEDGDFRGIYGCQYTPNYSAAIMELLIKSGYGADPRIERGFKWLLSVRQNDGGWAVPLRTVGTKFKLTEALKNPEPIKPDKSKPFSHCITGVVLRAFAAHEEYRKTQEANTAGELLKSRFFKPDKYPDRRAPSFWTKFSFPFWFTDLLSALDSLSLMRFSPADPQIKEALEWLNSKQKQDGKWDLPLLRSKDTELSLWIGLAICRVLKRFYG